MQFDPQSRHGVLVREPSGKDFVSGVNSPLDSIGAILLSGDWRQYAPSVEIQAGKYETDDCTGFGDADALEPQFFRLKRENIINPAFDAFLQENGYYDANGIVNFSDRALGAMAGTTSAGNYLDKVAETARTMGLIPETKWNSNPNAINAVDSDDFYRQYYQIPPPELLALAKQFLTFVDLPWHVIDQSQAPTALQQSPLYAALCTCGGWNTPPVPWCNAGSATNHAVALLAIQGQKFIFDSYAPFLKALAPDYNLPYLIQQFVIQKQPARAPRPGFKLATSPTVYIAIDATTLIPVASWPAFVELGGSTATIKTLSPDQFAKYTVISDVFLNK